LSDYNINTWALTAINKNPDQISRASSLKRGGKEQRRREWREIILKIKIIVRRIQTQRKPLRGNNVAMP